ncbi:MAG: porin [Prevotellaceae bacterium]|nr:porin [Prevotellaceae bacterium]
MKGLLFIIALIASCLPMKAAQAQSDIDEESSVRDTTILGVKVKENKTAWDDYRPEVGFFQKAFADKSDPRFMITNEDETFMFGIGGKFRITAFNDVGGAVNHNKFSSWDIPVPSERASHFGINVASSNLYVKSKIKLGKRFFTAYIGISNNDENKIELDQAYASYGGLSIGSTYSFFMDLAAGIHLVDLKGINTAVSKTHPLIGYTAELGKHWLIGVAAEKPELTIEDLSSINISNEYTPIPDFAMRGVFKGNWGHLQASAMLRSLSYWSIDTPIEGLLNLDGSSKYELGYGFSLSGKWNITPDFFVTFQSIYGKGIQNYVRDCSSQKLDLVPCRGDIVHGEQMYKMKTVPVYGGYVGMQYKWNNKFSSAAAVGLLNIDLDKYQSLDGIASKTKDVIAACKKLDYRRSSYIVVNTFYHVNDYCTVGLEYLRGSRWQRQRNPVTLNLTGETDRGDAGRIDLMFSYSF